MRAQVSPVHHVMRMSFNNNACLPSHGIKSGRATSDSQAQPDGRDGVSIGTPVRVPVITSKISHQTLRQSARRLDALFAETTKLRKIPKADESTWKNEGDTLAWELMRKGTIEFGGREKSTTPPLNALDFQVAGGSASTAYPTAFWQAMQFEPPDQIRQFEPTNTPTTTSLHLIYWHGGTGENMGAPWTPQEWDWLQRAKKAGTPVTVIVFGNPVAGHMLKDFSNVKGFVAWGRSEFSCQAAAAWMREEFTPGGQWPF